MWNLRSRQLRLRVRITIQNRTQQMANWRDFSAMAAYARSSSSVLETRDRHVQANRIFIAKTPKCTYLLDFGSVNAKCYFLHAFTNGICVANEHSTGALKGNSNAKCITHVNYPFEFSLYGRRRNDDDGGGGTSTEYTAVISITALSRWQQCSAGDSMCTEKKTAIY